MRSKTILVVDDSPTERRLVEHILKGKGYSVITAQNGAEAITKAKSEKPELIVLDVIMPGKNGFQVCRQLKSSSDTSHIKVILLTCKSQKSDMFWGMKQGADLYMTKPFHDDEFLMNVARLM